MAKETKAVAKIKKKGRISTATRKNAVIAALEKSMGVMTTASTMSGVNRQLIYKWIREDPEFALRVEDVQNVAIDYAESKLFKLIEAENPTAIIFYLKCRAKDRGYVDRAELDVRGQIDQKIEIEIVNNRDEITGN